MQSDSRIPFRGARPPFPQISFSQTLTLVPIFKKTGVSMNGDETQAVGKDLILDDGRVVVHQDLLYSHGRHLPKERRPCSPPINSPVSGYRETETSS